MPGEGKKRESSNLLFVLRRNIQCNGRYFTQIEGRAAIGNLLTDRTPTAYLVFVSVVTILPWEVFTASNTIHN